MERRAQKRFEVDLPVASKIRGIEYPNCRIRNCSTSGLFLEVESDGEGRSASTDFLSNLIGESITVNIPLGDDTGSPVYAVPFSVIRSTARGLGMIYSDAAATRLVTPLIAPH